MRLNIAMGRPRIVGFLLSAAVLANADHATAQGSAPWTAWLGCWEAVAPTVEAKLPQPIESTSATPVPAEAATLCVLPVAEAGVAELVMFENGSERERSRVTADGVRVAIERDGCSGWESVEASPDGRRIYRFSEFDCGGQFPRRTSSIMGFVESGEWVEVEGVSVSDFTDVRVMRYRLGTPSAEAALALESRDLQIDAARTAARARIGFPDVIDATRRVDAAVVEGWLIERNQGFELDAAGLRELASAGVPDRVIDLMVALSYPSVFAIDRNARQGEFVREELGTMASDLSRPLPPRVFDRYDPFYSYRYDPFYGYLYDPSYRYRYDPYYGYDRYSRYGNWYGPPVIIVKEPTASDDQPTRQRSNPSLVIGRGFSRGGTSASGSTSTGSSSSGSASPGTSVSTGSTATSQGGASAPARTAKPRSE